VVPPSLNESKIIAVRHQNVLATSFHPEVTDDLRIHRYFVDLVSAQ
jgi:pyridoxal 5'-phosphate synthase pdxT subunit